MKYSLRSLMTFSLRDLFWITVVAALVVGWGVERRANSLLRQELEKVATTNGYILKFLRMQDIKMETTEDGGLLFHGDGVKHPEEKGFLRPRNSSEPAPNPSEVPPLRFPLESDYQAPMKTYGERVPKQ